MLWQDLGLSPQMLRLLLLVGFIAIWLGCVAVVQLMRHLRHRRTHGHRRHASPSHPSARKPGRQEPPRWPDRHPGEMRLAHEAAVASAAVGRRTARTHDGPAGRL